MWGNLLSGIAISGERTDPSVRANRVHDGRTSGIYVTGGASPRIEHNEVWGNASEGIFISGLGTSPIVTGNVVRDGLDDGIYVLDAAEPTIESNMIVDNALAAIRVDDDADPYVGPNKVRG